jgi:hypothetical protein
MNSYEDAISNVLTLKKYLSNVVHQLDSNLQPSNNRKYPGDLIAKQLESISLTKSSKDSISGIMIILIQTKYLIPSKGTCTLLESGSVTPSSHRIRYRINLYNSVDKFLSPKKSSSSSSSSMLGSRASSKSIVTPDVPLSPPATLVDNVIGRNLSEELNRVANDNINGSSGTRSSKSCNKRSMIAGIVFYIEGAAILCYYRDNYVIHTSGLIMMGIFFLLWNAYCQENESSIPSINNTTASTTNSIVNSDDRKEETKTGLEQVTNELNKGVKIHLPRKPIQIYNGPYKNEFLNCLTILQKTLHSTNDSRWKCTTESITGLPDLPDLSKYRAHGNIHRMTPNGHKYSKFKLELYIPKEWGNIQDIVKYCKKERLHWDESMVKADVRESM